MPKFISPAVPISELYRIRKWHVEHAQERLLEFQLCDAVITCWFMGWVGWLPTFALDASWAGPLCLLGMLAPSLYIAWRGRAHTLNKLRYDWIKN